GIKDYVHRLEDVFAHARDGTFALQPQAFDRLFAGATALRDAIEYAGREGKKARALGPDGAELERLIAGGPAAPAAPAPRAPGLLVPSREAEAAGAAAPGAAAAGDRGG